MRRSRRRRVLGNVLFLLSVGLAVHLVLPELAGIRRSLELTATTSHPLVFCAFVAEVASLACYAEVLGRSAASSSGYGLSSRARRHRGLGLWAMLRVAVTGAGASHVLPGGGAASAAINFAVLRRRGLSARQVGLAIATVTALVYGALALLFASALVYLVSHRELGPAATVATLLALVVTAVLFIGSYVAYRNPGAAGKALTFSLRPLSRLLARFAPKRDVGGWARRTTEAVRTDFRAVRRIFVGRPVEAVRLVGFGFGYWGFDALCLVLMFRAFGVEVGTVELLVAYAIATVAGTLPLTPGGIGVFETTIVGTLALLGTGSEAILPVLGYRIFNFWMPIPLAAVLYPTLGRGPRTPGTRSPS